jgi:hypothetical protein
MAASGGGWPGPDGGSPAAAVAPGAFANMAATTTSPETIRLHIMPLPCPISW